MTKNFDQYKAKLMQNPDFVKQYNELEPEYQRIRQRIDLQLAQDVSQQELADRTRTRQSDMTGLENGNYAMTK